MEVKIKLVMQTAQLKGVDYQEVVLYMDSCPGILLKFKETRFSWDHVTSSLKWRVVIGQRRRRNIVYKSSKKIKKYNYS